MPETPIESPPRKRPAQFELPTEVKRKRVDDTKRRKSVDGYGDLGTGGHCKTKIVEGVAGKILRKLPEKQQQSDEIKKELFGHSVAEAIAHDIFDFDYLNFGAHSLGSDEEYILPEKLLLALGEQMEWDKLERRPDYSISLSIEFLENSNKILQLLQQNIQKPIKGFCAAILIRLLICDLDPNLGNFCFVDPKDINSGDKTPTHAIGIDYAKIFDGIPISSFPKEEQAQKSLLVSYLFENTSAQSLEETERRDKICALMDMDEVLKVMESFYNHRDTILSSAGNLGISSYENCLNSSINCAAKFIGIEREITHIDGQYLNKMSGHVEALGFGSQNRQHQVSFV